MYDGVFGPKWEDFRSTLTSHFADYPILPAKLPRNREAMEALARDGIVVLPSYLDPTTVTKLKEALTIPALALQAGMLKDVPDQSVDRHVGHGMCRLYDIDVIFKDDCAFFKEDPVILDLVQAYSSNKAQHCRMAVELRTASDGIDGYTSINNYMPHFDSLYREVKVFGFLDDVTEDNAPMVYWTGTHKDEEWRWIPDYLRFNGLERLNADRNFSQWRVNEFERTREDFNRVTCTGPAGTVVVADTRGLHRGSMLNKGYRLQIFSQYRMIGVCEYN